VNNNWSHNLWQALGQTLTGTEIQVETVIDARWVPGRLGPVPVHCACCWVVLYSTASKCQHSCHWTSDWIPRSWRFCLSHYVRTDAWAQPTPLVTGDAVCDVQQPGRWSWPHPSSAEVKNKWSCTSTTPYLYYLVFITRLFCVLFWG